MIFWFLTPLPSNQQIANRIFTLKSKISFPGALEQTLFKAPWNIFPPKWHMCLIKCCKCILCQETWKKLLNKWRMSHSLYKCCMWGEQMMYVQWCKWRMCNDANDARAMLQMTYAQWVCAQFPPKIDLSWVFCRGAKKIFRDLKSWWNFTEEGWIW